MNDLQESSWSDADWPLTAEQDLANFLAMTKEVFSADGTNPLPAFEALGFIAAYHWEQDRKGRLRSRFRSGPWRPSPAPSNNMNIVTLIQVVKDSRSARRFRSREMAKANARAFMRL